MLQLYRRHLSARYGGGCRFQPSCSEYARGCIERHGALVGLRLAVCRLRRCQPGYPCGLDPVPSPAQIGAASAGDLVVPDDAVSSEALTRASYHRAGAVGGTKRLGKVGKHG